MFFNSSSNEKPFPNGLLLFSVIEKLIKSPPMDYEFFRGRLADFGGIKSFAPKLVIQTCKGLSRENSSPKKKFFIGGDES